MIRKSKKNNLLKKVQNQKSNKLKKMKLRKKRVKTKE